MGQFYARFHHSLADGPKLGLSSQPQFLPDAEARALRCVENRRVVPRGLSQSQMSFGERQKGCGPAGPAESGAKGGGGEQRVRTVAEQVRGGWA